jgi:hypothetical protein
MGALVDQLKQLRQDLLDLVAADSEQEVGDPALPLIDLVLSEARERLPPGSTLGSQIVDLVSADVIGSGEDVAYRAAEVLVITGQLLAVLEHADQLEAVDAEANLEQDKRTWARFTEAVPRDKAIFWLTHQSWASWFLFENFHEPVEYVESAGLPDRSFNDAGLEELRWAFVDTVVTLDDHMTTYVSSRPDWPAGRVRYFAEESLDHPTATNAEALKQIQKASRLSEAVVRAYDGLWTAARRQLRL